MSMPNIPNVDPSITLQRDDAVNIILSSIGMEELSLAHIMNAEAEKIQFALGTLETADGAASMEQIMETNRSAGKMLRDVIKNQMLLTMKMEDTISLVAPTVVTTTTTTETAETKEETTTTEETATKEEVATEEETREETPTESEPVEAEAQA